MGPVDLGAWQPYCGPCGFKHTFTTLEELQAWMRAQERYYGPDHPFTPYRCPEGSGWHTRSRDDDVRISAGYNRPPA